MTGWELQKRGLQPTVAEKYEYLYTPEELGGLADTVKKMHGEVRRVYAKFNNNFRDFPIVNALQFRKRLGQEPPDPEALKATWQTSGCSGRAFVLLCLADDRRLLRPQSLAGRLSSTTRRRARPG